MSNDIFPKLEQLADAVTAMFGRSCEVAIHDLSDLRKSLVYIAGDVTGRTTGAPATDLLVKQLRKDPHEIKDMYNYKTTTRDGRSIKSTTSFLRNSEGEIVAAFCINLDTTDFFNAAQALSAFINNAQSAENNIHETFSRSGSETVEAIFNQTIIEMGKQPATMTTNERIELISRLEDQGVFQMKGAVNQIAELTGVSKYSIYNYIKNIRQNNQTT